MLKKRFRVLVLGNSGSGKTTAAEIIAEMLDSPPPRNCSDFIIEDYACSIASTPMKKLNLAKKILANKNEYRQELFKYGLARQKTDPAYPVSEAVRHTDVVTGVRTLENLNASKNLFDLILWINRIATSAGSTDKLKPEHADVVIDNNGSIKDLETNLRMILIREMTN